MRQVLEEAVEPDKDSTYELTWAKSERHRVARSEKRFGLLVLREIGDIRCVEPPGTADFSHS